MLTLLLNEYDYYNKIKLTHQKHGQNIHSLQVDFV